MTVTIEIEGLNELRARFGKSKQVFDREMKAAMEGSLKALQENVPEYPPPPQNSKYVRTERLGRSLGSSFTGGRGGTTPDIFIVKRSGPAGMYMAEFGSRLKYAPYVIGEAEQAWMHRGRWWKISEVARRGSTRINKLFDDLTKHMAAFLDGKRGL